MLVHIEVQVRREQAFPQRVLVYAYRLYDRCARDIASLAVLADTSPGWRPSGFAVGRWGSRLSLSFPSVKLLDNAGREAELEADANPFATLVRAHLAAQATHGDAEARFARKLVLTRELYERGLSKRRIIDPYRFIDWVLALPEDLEPRWTDAIFRIEEGVDMPYLSLVERRGEVRGAGLVVRGLPEQRFGPLPAVVIERLEQADAEQPVAWGQRVLDARSLAAVFADEGD